MLTRRGTLVIVGGEGGNRLTGGIGRQLGATVRSRPTRQRLTMFISSESHALLERLARLIEAGDVVPAVGQRFALEHAADAIRAMAAGATSGKSVIVVRGEEAAG